MKHIVYAALLAATTFSAAQATSISIVGPSNVSGPPGSTVGWGYQIVNTTEFYLLVDGSFFCGPNGDPQFTSCAGPYNGVTDFGPAMGTYNDFVATNATVIDPNATAEQSYDALATQGLGQYVIDPAATPGATDPLDPGTQTSHIFVTFMEFDGDPMDGGTQVSGDVEISAPVEVAATGASTPEPGTMSFILGAGALALFARVRRSRSRNA